MRAALVKWRKAPHDVILLDLHMPVLDGFGLAKAIRHEEAKRGLPRTALVAVTADAMKGKDARCYAAGMDGFVTKPVSIDALARTLGRWMPNLVAMPAPGGDAQRCAFRSGGVARPVWLRRCEARRARPELRR